MATPRGILLITVMLSLCSVAASMAAQVVIDSTEPGAISMLQVPRETKTHKVQDPRASPGSATYSPGSISRRLAEAARRPVLGGSLLLQAQVPSTKAMEAQKLPEASFLGGAGSQKQLQVSAGETSSSTKSASGIDVGNILLILILGVVGLGLFFVYRQGGSWQQLQDNPEASLKRAGAGVAGEINQALDSRSSGTAGYNPYRTREAPNLGSDPGLQKKDCLGLPCC